MRRRSSVREIRTNRDLLLLQIGLKRLLVVSCDAAGGIGSKSHDKVKASPRIVGRMTARVALMELLATGASPISITGTFAVEPEPTGNQILRGIEDEVHYAGIGGLPIICSSEKNVKVSQTSVGVTALGSLANSRLMIGRCRPGDALVAIGEPHVRDEVVEGARRRLIADTKDVCRLRTLSFVHEIIPVGSKGILHEAKILAKESKLSLTLTSSHLDLEKSAGPSTVLLCAVPSGSLNHVKRVVGGKPTNTIGYFYSR